jgi:hypothetical protein
MQEMWPSTTPAQAYFWGATCDGRRCLDTVGFRQHLDELGWEPEHSTLAPWRFKIRVLAFVAYLDDGQKSGTQVAAQLLCLAEGNPGSCQNSISR